MNRTITLMSAVIVLASGLTACSNETTQKPTQQNQSFAGDDSSHNSATDTSLFSYSNVIDDIKQKTKVPVIAPDLSEPLENLYYGIQYKASEDEYALKVYATEKKLEVNSPELNKPGSREMGGISGSKTNRSLNSFQEMEIPKNPKSITIDSNVSAWVDSDYDIFGYMEFNNWKVKVTLNGESATKKLTEVYNVLKNSPLKDFSSGQILLSSRDTFMRWQSEDKKYEYDFEWRSNSFSHAFEIIQPEK
ncbi:hypothetical protein NDK47_11105 [Brevibacillus ruminantium]|uniref:Lipoprotein n=1 Tax=Brevibacillus ruminantium TaxID=2950604 RepID=A0ABY4WKX9_9BACL|nr:hypothetical protein [Brevibacillus ruminantium]USG67782.1 hypothetical protein NDK47_11105 [Brevibacillus ruminantium]